MYTVYVLQHVVLRVTIGWAVKSLLGTINLFTTSIPIVGEHALKIANLQAHNMSCCNTA